MASNNSSSLCPGREWYLEAAKTTTFISHYIIIPLYLVFGLVIHGICLKAFFAEVKKEKGYYTQIYLTIARSVRPITSPLYIITTSWLAGSTSPSTLWFRTSYWFMAFASMITPTMLLSSTTACQLLTLLVSADRMYALWKPAAYNANHGKRKMWLFALVLVFVSIVSAVPIYFLFQPKPLATLGNTTVYTVGQNGAFVTSTLGTVSYILRTLVDMIGLVALYVCNVALVWLYRRRRLQSKKIMNKSSSTKKKEAVEKTLTLLALIQSFCITVVVTRKGVYLLLSSFDPTYALCEGPFHLSLQIAETNILDLVDVVCAFAVNSTFRRVILRAVCCCKKDAFTSNVGTTPVVSIRKTH